MNHFRFVSRQTYCLQRSPSCCVLMFQQKVLDVTRPGQRKSTRSTPNGPLLPSRFAWFVCCRGSRCSPQATCTFGKEDRSRPLSWKTKVDTCKFQLSALLVVPILCSESSTGWSMSALRCVARESRPSDHHRPVGVVLLSRTHHVLRNVLLTTQLHTN